MLIDPPGSTPTRVEGRVHEELVRLAKQGDAEAFDSLARMSGDRCLAIAVRILRDLDLAEDAVQAAFITAWTEVRTLRDPSRFEPWLHRILTNACHAEARRRGIERMGILRPGRVAWVSGLRVDVFGGRHADVYPGQDAGENVAVLVEQRVYHPGDSFTLPGRRVPMLLAPIQAP